MGRKKRAAPPAIDLNKNTQQPNVQVSTTVQYQPDNKKPKNGKEESYPVKKYRSDSYFASIEAFAKYTKAHRMLDAAFVRITTPYSDPERPFLFSTRIGGQDLAWGRGKTRDAAIDCACRAAFSLVQAHGYEEFALDEFCYTNMPSLETPSIIPQPPPPPPLPPNPPPLINSVPAAGFPPGGAPSSILPQPSALLNTDTTVPPPAAIPAPAAPSISIAKLEKKPEVVTTKNGLRLVFVPDVTENEVDETSMEERRALQPRYQIMLQKAVLNRRNAAVAAAAAQNSDDLLS